MTPYLDSLRREHALIERFLAVFNVLLDRFQKNNGEVSVQDFQSALQLIHNYILDWHCAKEEQVLLNVLLAKSQSEWGTPLSQVIREHQEARLYARSMEAALDALQAGNEDADERMLSHGRNFSALLSQHILKENTVIYPLTKSVFSVEDQRIFRERIAEVEALWTGPPDLPARTLAYVSELETRFFQ
jgi:hemerythrin-like domain-containing protein